MFLMLAFIGAQAALETNNADNPSAPLEPATLLYIAASFGSSLAVNVWVFYRVTGGMFNPAVSSTPDCSHNHFDCHLLTRLR